MCEILVRLAPKDYAASVDPLLHFLPGMPLVVLEDGHEWARKECPPYYFVVALPGVPVDRVLGYVREQARDVDYVARSNELLPSDTPRGEPGDVIYTRGDKIVRPREWQWIISEASRKIRDLIAAGRVVVGPTGDVSWKDARKALFSHRLGIYERRNEPRS